jgi:hypothetical protein
MSAASSYSSYLELWPTYVCLSRVSKVRITPMADAPVAPALTSVAVRDALRTITGTAKDAAATLRDVMTITSPWPRTTKLALQRVLGEEMTTAVGGGGPLPAERWQKVRPEVVSIIADILTPPFAGGATNTVAEQRAGGKGDEANTKHKPLAATFSIATMAAQGLGTTTMTMSDDEKTRKIQEDLVKLLTYSPLQREDLWVRYDPSLATLWDAWRMHPIVVRLRLAVIPTNTHTSTKAFLEHLPERGSVMFESYVEIMAPLVTMTVLRELQNRHLPRPAPTLVLISVVSNGLLNDTLAAAGDLTAGQVEKLTASGSVDALWAEGDNGQRMKRTRTDGATPASVDTIGVCEKAALKKTPCWCFSCGHRLTPTHHNRACDFRDLMKYFFIPEMTSLQDDAAIVLQRKRD